MSLALFMFHEVSLIYNTKLFLKYLDFFIQSQEVRLHRLPT